MNSSDKWFRWSLNVFLFLMCFQLGMLLFLKSLFYRAEQRLKNNEAEVAFSCGDFNNQEAYWNISPSQPLSTDLCLETSCPDSFWQGSSDREDQLHVVAVEKAQPSQRKNGEVEHGHFVNVKLKEHQAGSTKLALVSQSMMQWNLQIPEKHSLKEVLVIGSDLVWVDGLPEDVKLTYFSKEQICAFPMAWEEIKNSENEFRRLLLALKEYTGQEVTSFQGKKVGRQFQVPLVSPLMVERAQNVSRTPSSQGVTEVTTGIQWERVGKKLQAKNFQYFKGGKLQKIETPKGATDGYFEAATQKLFLINNHQFGTWDSQAKKFSPIHLPLNMPAMYWPIAMTFNPLKSEVYVYNDDRGGEILAYNVVTEKWRMFALKTGYSLVALHFDVENQTLLGTRFSERKIGSMVKMNQNGQIVDRISFTKPLDFSKNRWKAHILGGGKKEVWLKLTHPAHPGGDIYPLSQMKQTL